MIVKTALRSGWIRLYSILSCSLLLFALSGQQAQAQQYDEWAFGDQGSMNIWDPPATAYLTPPTDIDAIEGSASYCDFFGNLWFYTDGKSIYNYQLGTTIPNCLNGIPNASNASQGVIIVPKVTGVLPVHEFYIFTVTDNGPYNHGLSYYIYDAIADVVSPTPVTMGLAPGTEGSFCQERVQAVPHCNGTDFWVVVKPIIKEPGDMTGPGVWSPIPTPPAGATNNSLYAYHVSASGVNGIPVVSDAGYAADINPASNYLGDSKFSRNKELYATALRPSTHDGETHLYRFNCANGAFIHLQTMPFADDNAAISVSFSPDSEKLYVSGHDANIGLLRQYDLTDLKCNPHTIPPFCDLVTPFVSASLPYLQLGTNGIIYRSKRFTNHLDAILTPNNIGCGAINYTTDAVTVSGTPSVSVLSGLTNIMNGSVFNPDPSLTACPEECGEVSFWLTGCSPTLSWDFGDGTAPVSGLADIEVLTATTTGPITMPTHQFPPGGGTYTVTVTGADFTVTTTVTVTGAPAPLFSALGFPLCFGGLDPGVFTVANEALFTSIEWVDCSPPGNPYTFPTVTGDEFIVDPTVAAAGDYTLCVTATTADGCEVTVSFSFTISLGDWPKTTTSTNNYDWASGTEVDQYGETYICGEFRESTVFDGLFIPGNPSAEVNSFLTNYNACSDLEWVARSVSSKRVDRRSMSISQSLEHIYVTGRCEEKTTFYSGITPSYAYVCPSSITIFGNGIYVAIYDYNGCLLNVHMIYDDATFTHNSSEITSSISFGVQDRVYVGINETPTNPSNIVKMRVIAFTQSGAILNQEWIRPFSSDKRIIINDMDAYENTIGLTGTYVRNMFYDDPGPVNLGTNANVEEAYVIGLYETGPGALIMGNFTKRLHPGTGMAGGTDSRSLGEGIDCLDADRIFLTGSFIGNVTDPFDVTGTLPYFNAIGTLTDGYAISISNVNPALNWYHNIWTNAGETTGKAVKAVGSQLFVTGQWDGEIFYIDNVDLQTLAFEQHIYTIAMEIDGSFTGPNTWQNHSLKPVPSNGWIYSSDITANSNLIFVAGSYKGTFGMMNDIATNSPLSSTPSGISNLFLWRFDNLDDGFSKIADAPSNPTSKQLEVKLYPNPTSSAFTIELPKTTAEAQKSVAVYNIAGELVYEHNTLDSRFTINTQEWSKGLYIVRMMLDNEVYTQKLIVE